MLRRLPLFALLLLGMACSRTDSFAEVDRMLQAGETEGAVAALEVLKRQRGPRADIMLRLGSAHERRNEISRAVDAYKEGAEAAPESMELRLSLANLYFGLAQYESARDQFLAARACGADDLTVSIQLGTCLGRLEDLTAAEEEFRRAGAAGVPSHLVAYNQAIVQLALGNHSAARDFLEKSLAEKPDHHVATRELARVLVEAPDRDAASLERAVGLGWKAIEAMPEDWRSHDVLGQAYLAQGDWEAAKAAFVEALRFGRNPPVVEGHYVEAEKMRRAALGIKKSAGS